MGIFKVAVSYSLEASAELEGFGMKESITFTAEESRSTGGSKTESVTVSSTADCVAAPKTQKTCEYIAYKGTISVGYTVHWTNGATTRGTYHGEGWTHRVDTDTIPIQYSNEYKKGLKSSTFET